MRPFLVILGIVGLLSCTSPSPEPRPGLWRAWLDSPGGELPFGLEIERRGGGWGAVLLNGTERLEVPEVVVEGGSLRLGITHYDAAIEARLGDGRMDGRWWKTGQGGAISELPFHAELGAAPRFAPLGRPPTPERVAGRWSVAFAREDDPAVAELSADEDGTVQGTFLTTTGDYRFLAGSVEGDRLRLSAFDGAHAFLFDARVQEDGTLAGDFWSRESWHDTWTAYRDENAALPAATEEVAWIGGQALSELGFPDLEGRLRTLDDPEFQGKARILEIFGSWCPNCNDATQYLVELDRRYAERGLKVLGLAFEMTGDLARDTAQVRRYRDHHGIRYPLLIAGTSDKKAASTAFPLIERVKSFPTTIFLDGSGKVYRVYSGFSGPATGPAHDALRRDFEGWIEELLARP